MQARKSHNDAGQTSVEYAVVLTGFLALILALSVIHSFLENGQLVTHALESSSHGIEGVHFDNTRDIMSV